MHAPFTYFFNKSTPTSMNNPETSVDPFLNAITPSITSFSTSGASADNLPLESDVIVPNAKNSLAACASAGSMSERLPTNSVIATADFGFYRAAFA